MGKFAAVVYGRLETRAKVLNVLVKNGWYEDLPRLHLCSGEYYNFVIQAPSVS